MSSHSTSPPIQLVRKYRTICWRSVSGSNGHHFIPHYHRHLPAMNSLYRVSIMVAILQSNKSHQTKTFLCQKLNIKDSLRLKAGWRCTILARLLPFLILLFSGTWTNAKIVFFLGWKTGRSGAWSKFYPEHVKLLEIGKKSGTSFLEVSLF